MAQLANAATNKATPSTAAGVVGAGVVGEDVVGSAVGAGGAWFGSLPKRA